jgi:Tol biopolymer transport system component
MTSEEAFMIYGEDFSESGFLLAIDNEGFVFEPGSTHYLYIYTLIPEYGWDYTRKKISMPGETEDSASIQLSIDDPSQNEIIKEADKSSIRVSGWSVDFDSSNNTGVERIEVYLNGPRDFGEFLGEADYGIERSDVANTFGNANYINSGYSLYFDGSSLEEGSENTLYVYSFSTSGNYSLGMRDFKIEGEKVSNTIVSIEDCELDDQTIDIKGWATNKNWAIEGKPRSLDIEYSLKKIVFTSDRNGNEDIFSMNLDGTELTQLTDNQVNDNYPAVSPDGEKIAYTSDINGIWQIMVMNWDGTEKTQLTQNPWRSGYPAWSFDGRFIFFEVYQDGDWEIYRINSDGSNMKRLTFNSGISDWHPCGHPFQYKVIYESGTVGSEKLYIMDYDGDNVEKISDIKMRQRVPAVSIDGEMIIFAVYEDDNSYIYTMDISGENLNSISGSLTDCSHPAISPDNALVAFESVD